MSSDIPATLLACNLIGLVLAIGLLWVSRNNRDTPEGRAGLLEAATVVAFAVAGIARRIHHPMVDQITLGAWIVAVTATAWKLADQRHINRDHQDGTH